MTLMIDIPPATLEKIEAEARATGKDVQTLVGEAIEARFARRRQNSAGEQLDAGPWTEAKAARRCELVDREFDGALTAEEAVELEELQRQMLRERQRLAPIPLDDLRRLHQELLAKAQQQSGQNGP